MKGWVAGPSLRDDLPEPSGDVVEVRATSVNRFDTRLAEGVLGCDFAGVDARGDEVFGWRLGGAWAERVEAGPFVARKPQSLTMAAAGAAALAGSAALSRVEALGLRRADRVLIVGATGGVGAFAVQLCVAAGAAVIAPALEIDAAYLEKLGVAEVVERDARPATDHVLDLVAPDPIEVRVEHLSRLAALIDEHSMRVPICEAFSFGEVPAALSAFADHKQGKLSIA